MANYRNIFFMAAVWVATASATTSCGDEQNSSELGEYELVWHDEFDDPAATYPSGRAYSVPERHEGVTWARFISREQDLMVVADGVLRMYCRPNPVADRNETNPGEMVSGAIQTKGRFSFNTGRVEARIRVEGYRGSFPAFWLMPEKQPSGWPTGGEIDIFESINDENRAYATLHAGLKANQDLNTPGYQMPVEIGDWHVYGLDWTPDSMKFTIDGRVCGTVTRESIREGVWPFDKSNFYIILNQSVGKEGGWAAAPDTTHTYLTEVDWVRVYQRPGSSVTGASTSPSPLE